MKNCMSAGVKPKIVQYGISVEGVINGKNGQKGKFQRKRVVDGWEGDGKLEGNVGTHKKQELQSRSTTKEQIMKTNHF